MIEGSGSVHLTNGSRSGSRRPENIRILWIRIHNTGKKNYVFMRDENFRKRRLTKKKRRR
jgi:hypothetical protein